jgi:hypothetical protein
MMRVRGDSRAAIPIPSQKLRSFGISDVYREENIAFPERLELTY